MTINISVVLNGESAQFQAGIKGLGQIIVISYLIQHHYR